MPLLFGFGFLLDLANTISVAVGGKNVLSRLLELKPGDGVYEKAFAGIAKFGFRYLPMALWGILISLKAQIDIGLFEWMLIALSFNVWFLAMNWNKSWVNLYAVGGGLNSLVCVLNGGRMPALYGPEESVAHQWLTSETVLPFLADWIEVGNSLISVGDVFLFSGAVMFFMYQAYRFLDYLRQ
jgi:hypothetical protein